ncbi:MAG: nucleotidyltransferase family protein [Deltaproteobacteria bacterium]|nr:nucleotidyltransferase family protein [Deltaproteobacteria bacterium]
MRSHSTSPAIEERIILAAVTREPNRRDELGRLLAQGPNFERLLRLAVTHGVDGLLSLALGPHLPARADPRTVDGAIKARAELIGAANRVRVEELDQILRAFSETSILALPLKGPVAALAYHGDLRARRFGDLDVLVEKPRVDEALGVLHRMGYEQTLSNPHRIDFARNHLHALELRRRDTWVMVELHFRLSPKYFDLPMDTRILFDRARDFVSHGRTYRVLSPTDALVFLCVHGAKHAWSRLLWVADLDRLVSSQPIDWAVLKTFVEKHEAARLVRTGLALTREILGTRLEAADEWVSADRGARALAKQAADRLFDRESEPGPLESQWYRARSRDRRRTAAKDWVWFVRDILEPTEEERSRLPEGPLQRLGYLVRPLSLLRKRLRGRRDELGGVGHE